MTIKAICFDLDDTLLWDDKSVNDTFRAVCQAAKSEKGLDPEKLEEAVRHRARELYSSFDSFAFTQMIGINPFEALWARFGSDPGVHFRRLRELAPYYRKESWFRGLKDAGVEDANYAEKLGEAFAAERRKRPIVYEETFEVLEALKGSYRLLMLTNGSPELQREKIAAFPALAPYFDHIVISGHFGKGKPDVSIFQHALQLLDVGADEAVMVGDKLTTDILGASLAGMTSVWINRKGQPISGDIEPDHEIDNLKQLLDRIR